MLYRYYAHYFSRLNGWYACHTINQIENNYYCALITKRVENRVVSIRDYLTTLSSAANATTCIATRVLVEFHARENLTTTVATDRRSSKTIYLYRHVDSLLKITKRALWSCRRRGFEK